MSYLKRLFRWLVSWRMLACVAILLACAVVWFLGPLFVFGELHPFAGAVIRSIVIALLIALLVLWLRRWPLSPIWVIALCVALWHVGPLFGFAEHHPLEPIWVRVLIVAAIVFCYALYGLYRLWQALRSNDALLKRFLEPKGDQPAEIGRDEVRAVAMVVSKAIAQLKRLRGGTLGWRRLLEVDRHLYGLPWYMMLGTPGAGKTTAILGSGLQFPLTDQMGAVAAHGIEHTANCEWWFANEAVLIDTAGRYVEQDDAQDETATAVNAAEWKELLGQLRKHRPRAPLNGAILNVSVADLVNRSEVERTALAASLRARLGELRQQLGIRFPVYVFVTKLDLLPGFTEYFQSLTADGRTQIWGFTLPCDESGAASVDGLRRHCMRELALLEARADAGLNNRLLEEYEGDRRKRLYPLAQEFRSLSALVADLVELVFLDSRYDDAQLQSMLRGVYFTSAEQTDQVMTVDRDTVLQRLRRKMARLRTASDTAAQARGDDAIAGHRSFFLRNVFQHVIVPEAHLVRADLKWEIRFRTMRWAGHLLTMALFVWLAFSLTVSYENNRNYLAAISGKTSALAAQAAAYSKAPKAAAIGGLLDRSRDLPRHGDLDLDAPGLAYRYGLYVVPAIVSASDTTYLSLLQQTLLPQIVARVEGDLNTQLAAQNSDDVYRTLAIYLMLYDAERYDAKAVRAWVLRDWERSDSAAAMGGRNAMTRHLDALFVDDRPVKPSMKQDAALVQRARLFLSQNPAPKRLYERAIGAMEKEAPENFTLAQALGLQGASLFKLVDGSRFEQGVPGLYTYDGYHALFSQRLPEFLARAQDDDDWVMGRPSKRNDLVASIQGTRIVAARSSLADEIRRQYLIDYGNYWQQFLADIRPATSGENGRDGTLALDQATLRALAAPDSPLVRLARAVVRETSLSVINAQDPSSLNDLALAAVGRRSSAARTAAIEAGKIAAQRPETRLEKEFVDNRFAALREVTTGQADTGSGPAMTDKPISVGGKALQLDAILTLINEQYTRLVVASNALSANSMPPALDIGTTLQTEAEKLPAPLRLVLGGIATQVADKVGQEVGGLLAMQVDTSVGQSCRRTIDGKYPFVRSSQEVDVEDFNRMFASGGVFDEFFQKSLASYVDTNAKPWRYKSLSPGMPPIKGPSLAPFERAAAIREVFFRDQGAKRMAWKMDAKVAAVDPEITELLIDVDGQTQRYVHGPVTPFALSWPGPRGGAIAEISARPAIRPDTSTIVATGPWALFRLIERGRLTGTASASRLTLAFDFDGRHAALELMTSGQSNPLTSNLLTGFHCPGGLA
ncbi:type VI secretion system membrane subunit TssM [Burkholderia latens]|uniref:Type VI secretion protein VasK n=1 Tax=Burkholderia latens TaxID=488446 RepID=A0A6H9TF76_9BURK|nr:type VI secretion system membrane subunit TssM [Burkholderia latens]KAB0642380.1 type VI secretion system membrane subunit TssM [Burkholderia latens]VWC19231.1 type VI secretion protein VasK [Burkholderia latens]